MEASSNKRYQVLVSSTFTDLVTEREAVTQVVLRTGRCIPAGMELFSASSQPPWDVIRRALEGTDYLILIIGNRSGALVPGEEISYTEKDYQYAVKNHIPVLAFLSSDAYPFRRDQIESAKAQEALVAFRDSVRSTQLTEDWTTKEELATRVVNALWKAFTDTPRPGWVRGELVAPPAPPAVAPAAMTVGWSLEWVDGDRYILENIGTATAYDVDVFTNDAMIGPDVVEGGPNVQPTGVLTFSAVRLTVRRAGDPQIRVVWRPAPDADFNDWSHPLPGRGDR